MNRRKMLKSVGIASTATFLPGVVNGKRKSEGIPQWIAAADGPGNGKSETLKEHDTSRELGIIGSQISFHQSQDRAAFISGNFAGGIEIYVAEGVTTDDDVPSNVYQVTSNSELGSFGPVWSSGNTLEFQRNLSRYSVKLPPSNKVLGHRIVEENVVDVETTLKNSNNGGGE